MQVRKCVKKPLFLLPLSAQVGVSDQQVEELLRHAADNDGDGRISYREFVQEFGAAAGTRGGRRREPEEPEWSQGGAAAVLSRPEPAGSPDGPRGSPSGSGGGGGAGGGGGKLGRLVRHQVGLFLELNPAATLRSLFEVPPLVRPRCPPPSLSQGSSRALRKQCSELGCGSAIAPRESLASLRGGGPAQLRAREDGGVARHRCHRWTTHR